MHDEHPRQKADLEDDPAKAQKLNEYRARAKEGRIYRQFKGIEDFRDQAIHAISALRNEFEKQTLNSELDALRTELSAAKKEIQELEGKLREATFQRQFFWKVNEQFLKVVSEKRERLKNAQSPNGGVLRALRPELQWRALIVACWDIFSELLSTKVSSSFRPRLRVAYFRLVGTNLELASCWNGTSGDCVSLNSSHRERFALDAPENMGCLAQAVAKEGRAIWAPSAKDADADPTHPFAFFHKGDKDSLKSIVGAPIILEGQPPPSEVVVLDTDVEGFFVPGSMTPLLNYVVNNMAHRLHMEKQMERLFLEEQHV